MGISECVVLCGYFAQQQEKKELATFHDGYICGYFKAKSQVLAIISMSIVCLSYLIF